MVLRGKFWEQGRHFMFLGGRRNESFGADGEMGADESYGI